MPEVLLSKCMKIKNRLSGRLNSVEQDIKNYNSSLEEQVGFVDVRKLYILRGEISKALVDLKTLIMKTNVPIQNAIIRLSEVKATISFISSIDTNEGIRRHAYQNTTTKYVAVVTKDEIDQRKTELEGEIDKIQDDLDAFNGSTKVNLPQTILDLAS